jgi:hypothetical protein
MLDLDEFTRLLASVQDVASLGQLLSASDAWQGRLRVRVVVPGEASWEGIAAGRMSEQVFTLPWRPGSTRTLRVWVRGASHEAEVAVEVLAGLEVIAARA